MLSDIQISEFKEKGHIIIKNFYPKKQIFLAKKNILKLIKKDNGSFFYFEDYRKKKLRRIERVSECSKDAKRILQEKKLKKVISELTGKKNFLFKDKINFKFPGGKGFEPHIDGHFFWKSKNNKINKGWKKYANSFINVVVPLEKSDKFNGCLYLSKKIYTSKIVGDSWEKITLKLQRFTPIQC